MTEGRILFCDVFPEAPAAAGTNFSVSVGRMILITVDGTLGTASVGDKYQIVLGEKDAFLHAVYLALDSFCHFLAIGNFKDYVGNFSVILEVYASCFQILNHRKDQGLVLVVSREFQSAEIRKSADVMDESLEVELHFQSTVPVFKSKHGPPVQPEGGIKDFVVKNILDGLVVQILILGEEKLHDLHAAFLAQVEFSIGVSVLAAVNGRTAERIVGVMLVQPVILVQNGSARFLKGRNAAEQIPQALEMILHLTAAAHHITSGRIKNTVTGAAGNVHGFQDVNVGAGHLGVADHEAGSCQSSQTASYQVSMLVIHAFRFLRAGKSFVVSVAVVDAFAVFLVHSALGVAVIAGGFFHLSFFYCFFLTILCCECCCTCSCCHQGCQS